MHILKKRQVSACECAFRLGHLNLRESSLKGVFNTMNLMTFVMLFGPYYPRRNENSEDNIDQDAYEEERTRARRKLIALQNNTKMAVRSRPACATVLYIIAANDPKNYYYSLLLQYVPYHSEDELLDGFNSAREAFQAREELLRDQCEMMEIYRK
ncbi:ATP-dependent DNA helicase [Nephila pilipes]|uniref:ATP-dependent DNA helicase n=1 Tax=Nephila pilipes TaxID=299642 RepID=A0A8X6U3C2_NEPPI|nr:ATP-dependent DNA helicase [Nephila pilipes]